MPKAKITTNYECSRCTRSYDAKYQAELCCPTTIHAKFVCSVCEEIFWVESQALRHVELSHGEENTNAN